MSRESENSEHREEDMNQEERARLLEGAWADLNAADRTPPAKITKNEANIYTYYVNTGEPSVHDLAALRGDEDRGPQEAGKAWDDMSEYERVRGLNNAFDALRSKSPPSKNNRT